MRVFFSIKQEFIISASNKTLYSAYLNRYLSKKHLINFLFYLLLFLGFFGGGGGVLIMKSAIDYNKKEQSRTHTQLNTSITFKTSTKGHE